MPPCRLRRKNCENLTTKWCILKYIWINNNNNNHHELDQPVITRITSPPFRKLHFLSAFVFFIFHPLFERGVSWPHLRLCADAHGPSYITRLLVTRVYVTTCLAAAKLGRLVLSQFVRCEHSRWNTRVWKWSSVHVTCCEQSIDILLPFVGSAQKQHW